MPASIPHNLWIPAGKREAMIMCVRAIEQGSFQLKYDRFQRKAAQRAACRGVPTAAIERGCQRLCALLDALEDDEGEI